MDLELANLKSQPYREEEDLLKVVELINHSAHKDGAAELAIAENVRQYLRRPEVERPQLWQDGEGRLVLVVTLRVLTLHQPEGPSLEARLDLNVHPAVRGRGLEKQ